MPTITDRDFVIATVAPPTIIKEPEKPAEGEAAEGAEKVVKQRQLREREQLVQLVKEGEAVKAKTVTHLKKMRRPKMHLLIKRIKNLLRKLHQRKNNHLCFYL